MAEISVRRVATVGAAAGALVGGLVAAAIAVTVASGGDGGTATTPDGGGAVATAAVVRTNLSSTVQDGGSIGYEGSYTITALGGGGGVYTWLPQPGQVIRQDEPVYSVDNELVPLLYGPVPAWRAFNVGMPAGPDVGELTRDLIRLGYGAGLSQSDNYSAATAAAVEHWQAARGLPATGKISLGGVVFEPGPIQVTSTTPSPGAPAEAAGGTVLTATGTTPVVTVDVDVSQEYLVRPGDAVQVVLPDGTTTVGGRIQTVGSVATCPGSGGTGTGSGSAGQSPCSSAGSGTNSSPTVTVTISLDGSPPLAGLDQAPVNVNITTQRADNVLAVPVTALLALQDGGYGVQVVTGKTSHLVAVTAGLYGNNLVQVSGPGMAAGMRVQVPS